MKNVAVLSEDGAFALFFRPHPREFAIQGKKNANARGSGGWAHLELFDALFQVILTIFFVDNFDCWEWLQWLLL